MRQNEKYWNNISFLQNHLDKGMTSKKYFLLRKCFFFFGCLVASRGFCAVGFVFVQAWSAVLLEGEICWSEKSSWDLMRCIWGSWVTRCMKLVSHYLSYLKSHSSLVKFRLNGRGEISLPFLKSKERKSWGTMDRSVPPLFLARSWSKSSGIYTKAQKNVIVKPAWLH